MNVVVFSGTTEGRELSRQLAALGIEVTVSVATPLGQEEQGSTPGITVRCRRLLPDEMAALLGDAALCIDATHPYAVEATKNIKAAAEKAGVEYLRLLRPALNQAMMEQLHICWLVTKDGGAAGGFDEKAAAASAAGAQLVVIRRPPEQGETASEVLKRCKEMIR